MALAYEHLITENKDQFIAKVLEISRALNINPNWLMTVMKSESGLNHRITNSIGCAGLIQFCEPTISGLGTTAQALISMSNVEQLDFVYKYYNFHKTNTLKGGNFKGVFDLYLCTFYPYALTQSDDFVLGSEQSDSWARLVGQQNKPFDLNGDGYIQKFEFKKWIANNYGTGDGTWSNYIEVQTKKVLRPKVLIVGAGVLASVGLVLYFITKDE